MFEYPRYTRDPFPELPFITDEERRGKHFFFEDPTNQEEQIIAFLTNTAVKAAIVNSWSESTKYPENSAFGPSVKYEHKPGMPNGQCGVTAMALGMAMVRYGIAPPEKIFYEEGKLRNARGEIIDEHHAWLRVEGDEEGKEWRIDLTSYQYAKAFAHPDEQIETVVQGVNHMVGHYMGINWRRIDSNAHPVTWKQIPVPNAISLAYEVDEVDGKKCSTPISEYDVTPLEGRIERFNYKYKRQLGSLALEEKVLWYPPNYDTSKETWNPNEDIDIVYRGREIHDILEARQPATLAVWAHDCAMHALLLNTDPKLNEDLRGALKLLDTSIWKGTVSRGDIVDAAHACGIISRKIAKHDKTAQFLAVAVQQALITGNNSSSYNAKRTATSALWATYYSDQSDLKMSVIKELEWQQKHIGLVTKIMER